MTETQVLEKLAKESYYPVLYYDGIYWNLEVRTAPDKAPRIVGDGHTIRASILSLIEKLERDKTFWQEIADIVRVVQDD